MPPQILLVQLDRDLAISDTVQRHIRDARQLQQLAANILGDQSQFIFLSRIRRNREGHHFKLNNVDCHDRPFGANRRKVLKREQSAFDVVQNSFHTGKRINLNSDPSNALTGDRNDAIDAGQTNNAFLQSPIDVLFNLFRSGPG